MDTALNKTLFNDWKERTFWAVLVILMSLPVLAFGWPLRPLLSALDLILSLTVDTSPYDLKHHAIL